MVYNIKLNEREFGIILNSLTKDEKFDIIKPLLTPYSGEEITINFQTLLEYGNAFLIKCRGLDEEKDYQRLNCETHVKQCEKKKNWIDGYEYANGIIKAIS